MNYFTDTSDDLSVSDLSVSAEVEVLLYRFDPVTSDSESIGHGGKAVHGKLDSVSRVRLQIGILFKQACISDQI